MQRTSVLFFAPESNGEVAYRGFKERERQVGLPLADLAESYRGVRYDFADLGKQPRRILTSPCWSGIVNNGRAYTGYAMNIERLIPWRTLTGRQHLYLDHEAYRAFGESCPTFKPRISSRKYAQYCQQQAFREGHHPGLHHAARKMAHPFHLLRRLADAHSVAGCRTLLAE